MPSPSPTSPKKSASPAARSANSALGLFNPTVRLGVTGLSGAGKTVFITALVHQLLHGGRLPVFEALASGRIARARLEPQPDDAVPRFDYETPSARADRRAALAGVDQPHQRAAPRHRLPVGARHAQPHAHARHRGLSGRVAARPAAARRRAMRNGRPIRCGCRTPGPRAVLAARWHKHLATLDPDAPENEQAALQAAQLFTEYLQGLPRRALRDAAAAARPLPDAGRSRGLAGADLCAARTVRTPEPRPPDRSAP